MSPGATIFLQGVVSPAQAIELGDRQFAILETDPENRKRTAIKLFNKSGKLMGLIGTYGILPGQYSLVWRIAYEPRSRTLWVTDVITHRVSEFDLDGKLRRTIFLASPGFAPFGVAADEPRGRIFISGCVPLNVYVDKGCSLLHEYDLTSGRFKSSAVLNDPSVINNRLLGYENFLMDVGSDGSVYFIEGPVSSWIKYFPDTKQYKSFEFRSVFMSRIPEQVIVKGNKAERDAFGLADGIFITSNVVLIPIRKAHSVGYTIEALDATTGMQIAQDMDVEGHVIGKSLDSDGLWTARSDRGGVRLTLFTFSRKAR